MAAVVSPRPVSLIQGNGSASTSSRFSEQFLELSARGREEMSNRNRTPSPTPTEQAYLDRKTVVNWRPLGKWRFWIRRDWIVHYIILTIVIAGTVAFIHYQRKLVHALNPFAHNLRDLPAGWVIPIGILIIMSFPPLFGQEIIAILCGLVWGLWIGFGIVAAGTLIGELGNFYAFRYCCRSRAEKLEKNTVPYACFVKIVRQGGFKIALISRYSIIPGHLTTAVYSTSGIGIGVFCAAAILSLPKHLALIYVGVLLEDTAKGNGVSPRVKSAAVVCATLVITALAFWYVLREMNKVKDTVVRERQKARHTRASSLEKDKEVDIIVQVEGV